MNLKGYVIRDGKLVKKPARKTPVQHARERNSKKQKPVSRARAELHSTSDNRK